MSNSGLANAEDLLHFAEAFGSAEELPRIVRQLVLETVPSLRSLEFAAGKGVLGGGWDGIVDAPEGTAFVPEGISAWELSVNKDTTAKANKDYTKRLTGPGDVTPRDCTYVQVSLRRWGNKQRWADDRESEGRWKAVRAYDIETWLETAPASHLRVSKSLGIAKDGVDGCDSWWDRWAARTTPTMAEALVMGGREGVASAVGAYFDGTPTLRSIAGGSREDALAFVAAVLRTDSALESARARALIVEDVGTWQQLVIEPGPLVLLPAADDVIALAWG
jgi:hypothetical protein